MNTSGCFYWLNGCGGFFCFLVVLLVFFLWGGLVFGVFFKFQYAVFLFHAWKAIDFFFPHRQKFSLYLWYERSSSYRVDWNFLNTSHGFFTRLKEVSLAPSCFSSTFQLVDGFSRDSFGQMLWNQVCSEMSQSQKSRLPLLSDTKLSLSLSCSGSYFNSTKELIPTTPLSESSDTGQHSARSQIPHWA